MILINVRFTVRPERVDGWLDFARPFTEATRSEPGNLWFDWYRSTENPQEFFLCEAFRDGDAPVFLISLKAGGFGLTLTEADYVFLLDPWWNPAAENQAVDRAHRIGQERQVMVYRMIAEDTIEEKVLALQQRKAELFDALTDGGDAFRAAVTAEDLRELLS